MTPARCPRSFEVEAMRDGRLAGAELASFARHLNACAECAREARALEGLAEAVRALADQRASTNELHAWRERTRLMAAFDGTLLAPERGRRGRRLLPSAAVAAVAVAAGWLLLARTRVPPHSERPVAVEIRPEAHAVWEEKVEGDRKQVFLSRGTLRIHVDHWPGRDVCSSRFPTASWRTGARRSPSARMTFIRRASRSRREASCFD